MIRIIIILSFLSVITGLSAQIINQNKSYLATFGNMSSVGCVDDDFSQTTFIAVPVKSSRPFYIRVLDPDCGGEMDIMEGRWETNTLFEIYGGKGCISESDARDTQPVGNYKSGTLLSKSIFAKEAYLDGKWYSFGPYNTEEGEMLSGYPGYSFFKIIVEGRTGDDANVYDIFISSSNTSNSLIDQTTLFAYEEVKVSSEDFVITRNETLSKQSGEIRIPVALKKIHSTPAFSIEAEPIGD